MLGLAHNREMFRDSTLDNIPGRSAALRKDFLIRISGPVIRGGSFFSFFFFFFWQAMGSGNLTCIGKQFRLIRDFDQWCVK